jgi:cellulose synthase/poly-beta-1,6-N-acetylglucosamine synthase-like glycosyltransferase
MWLIYGFTEITSFEHIDLPPMKIISRTKFTIIVPFRNEASDLPLLLNSFSKLNYPMELFEVLLIDDESEKVFNPQYYGFSLRIVKNNRLSTSPKKDAITTAIQIVKSDWVITTDADCIVPKNWLQLLDSYIQRHDVAMIAGAVTYDCDNRFLHHFQQLDLASLQGATIGSFGIGKGFMCNGANLAYTKSLFDALHGFEGNDSIASGDDVFLLQKAIARFPKSVHYLKSKSNIVVTAALGDWKSLFHQRVRWASKTTSYQSKFGQFLGLVVFSGNLAWILALIFSILGLISGWTFSFLAASKFLVDLILLYKANQFLSTTKMRYVLFSSILYPFFSVSVALYSLLGKYQWKDRSFSRSCFFTSKIKTTNIIGTSTCNNNSNNCGPNLND